MRRTFYDLSRSTFLGDGHVADTYWYLSVEPELMGLPPPTATRFALLLELVEKRLRKPPSGLALTDLDPFLIGAFLAGWKKTEGMVLEAAIYIAEGYGWCVDLGRQATTLSLGSF